MTDYAKFFDGILNERQVKLNEPMSRHTTYGIGGPADAFVMPTTEDELIAVLKKAHEEGIPVTVIGGGSNCLVSDLGIRGITICMNRMQQNMTCEAHGSLPLAAPARVLYPVLLKRTACAALNGQSASPAPSSALLS